MLCLWVLWLLLPVSVCRAEGKVVRVGSFEDTFNFIDQNGVRRGYGYELMQKIAGYTGWTFEYVTCDWSNCFEKLENGEIDIMGDISYTDERAEKMLYSDMPMGEEKYILYADLEASGIRPSDLSTINGRHVGALLGSKTEMMLTAWEKKHGIETTHSNTPNFDEVNRKLAAHEIECFVSLEQPFWKERGISRIDMIGKSDIYFVINKNRADIKKELDEGMRQLEEDDPFFLADLYKQYFSFDIKPVLTGEEQNWVNEHGAIRIGYLKDEPGISVKDPVTGKKGGVLYDYMEYADDCLGNQQLDFEPIEMESRAALREALQTGKIDMIFTVSNPNAGEEKGIAFTNTAWTYNLFAVTEKKPFEEMAANRVAILKDNLPVRRQIEYYYPQWTIIPCRSVKEARNKTVRGEADCFVTGARQAVKYTERNALYSIPLSRPLEISFGVKSGQPQLLAVLNKTLKAMPIGMLSSSFSMHENAKHKVTLEDYIKDNLLLFSASFLLVTLQILSIFILLLQKARKAERAARSAAGKAKDLNEKLQIAVEKAEGANRTKTNFLNNMSHDIRTPMNAILGYNRLMRKKLTDPQLIDYQRKIEQSGSLLLSIINHVLDMARIESGKSKLDENAEVLGMIFDEAYGVFAPEAAKKEIRMKKTIAVEHRSLICDGTKIREIFVNLISNAVKYTPRGGSVEVNVNELPCEREGFARIQTVVTDTGIGMSKEYLPTIYDSFSRERNTTMGKVAGTGLGMAIVKELVTMMGGTIEVKSELGEGTTFTVTLDHKIAETRHDDRKEIASRKAAAESLADLHILLAEDNDLNAEIAMTLLEEAGLKVDRAADGIQCVSRIEKEPAGTYALILMDIQMPNMDGYKATETIRQLPDPKKAAIPIIAMTANAFEEDRKMALAKGMNGYIAKPIDPAKMLAAIQDAIEK
ncbi:MAG: transporter substrate-binding domain-containing protein [Dialister sp.]|nr:transporter substrate-binding domain-containing protein [Dialister sp.]